MPEIIEGPPVTTRNRFQLWLHIEERAKPKVYSQIFESARLFSLNYWLEIIFSAAIATLGLVLNSPAVIIGAMLISPLMGPIMATGMALAVGDLYLLLKAVTNVAVSVAGAVALAAFIVWSLPFHSATSEIIARINPNLLDLGVAVFSGLAGSVVVSRGGGGGGVTALPGVAIAVALMPPLCTVGFGFGTGSRSQIIGAGLLFLTNLVAIVSSAFLVFTLVGMNCVQVCNEMERMQQGDPLAQFLSRGPLGQAFSNARQLRWRILILVVFLGAVALPLRRALMQVAGDTFARSEVQSVVQNLAPSDAMVSQHVQIGREAIAIRLISTQNIPALRIKEAEKLMASKTGRNVELSVQEVASKGELADLVSRMNAPAQASEPTPVATLGEMRKQIMDRVSPVIKAAWPTEAPLQNFDVALDANGILCRVQYQGDHDLGEIPIAMVTRTLQEKLSTPNVSVEATRTLPPPVAKKKKHSGAKR